MVIKTSHNTKGQKCKESSVNVPSLFCAAVLAPVRFAFIVPMHCPCPVLWDTHVAGDMLDFQGWVARPLAMNLGLHPGEFRTSQQTAPQAAQLHGYGRAGRQPPLQLLISQMQPSPEQWVSSKLAQGPGFSVRGMGSTFADWEAWNCSLGPCISCSCRLWVCTGYVAHTAELAPMK